MKTPLEISFQGITDNYGLKESIIKKAGELFAAYGQPEQFQISISSPDQYPLQDKPFFVRIDMNVQPGKHLVVERSSINGRFQERIMPIINESFDSIYDNLARING